jgi:para-aminobenzoate synthetase component I
MNLFKRYSELDGFMIFGSTDKAQENNPSILKIFLEPCLKIWSDGKSSWMQSPGGMPIEHDGAFTAIDSATKLTKGQEEELPLAGFFSYELLHSIESIQHTNTTSKIPSYLFYGYKTRITTTETNNKTIVKLDTIDRTSFWTIEEDELKIILKKLTSSTLQTTENTKANSKNSSTLKLEEFSNFSKDSYIESVKTVKELIRAGEVYQVNLSQQFKLPFDKSSFTLFSNLTSLHPSEFSSYISAKNLPEYSDFSIVSNSPELLLSAKNGCLLTSPIKGTRKREPLPDLELKAIYELKNSTKDLAELSMIVDLERNDLGKICEIGSIQVKNHARINSISHLHHLVTDITGKLIDNLKISEIIKAIFPGGSITGAPKIAAMKIISLLEQKNRGAYTGAIGEICRENNFTLSVAIRTATIQDKTITFNSGGGIVIDSDPNDEYLESMAKADGILEAYFATISDD